ncbi:TIGR02117 family protein [Nitratireductor sp. CAU 1489]|uniref:TIGR02117 family protein n=1 Tax=Nitratireductor arenosus TaxID=2682096 RepID=A0A844QL29_9HYPH|nr:TIGR02117 family protein [Nitratireductor arenosus]MVA99284.1 TIGR02117 family protein [Nitratireductor arenosus]
MRRALWGLVVIAGLVIAAIAAGVLIPLPFQAQRVAAPQTPSRLILLLSNPIHTDIALPLDGHVRGRFKMLAGDGFPLFDGNARWLVVGWGGRSFYLETPTWADLKLVPILRALTLDRSVMHVEIAGEIPLEHPAVTPLEIDEAGFSALLDFVGQSFAPGAGGDPVLLPNAGYGAYDRFYEARGRFNALVGCNVWTARALRRAGIRTGGWTPLPGLLRWSLRRHNPQPIAAR